MTAKVSTTPTTIPASIEEMNDLVSKVKASNTYKHSFYIIMIRTEHRHHRKPWRTKQLYLENVTSEEATAIQTWAEDKATKEYNQGSVNYKFILGNKFDNYTLYKEAGGREDIRALQWQNINEIFRIENHKKIALKNL